MKSSNKQIGDGAVLILIDLIEALGVKTEAQALETFGTAYHAKKVYKVIERANKLIDKATD